MHIHNWLLGLGLVLWSPWLQASISHSATPTAPRPRFLGESLDDLLRRLESSKIPIRQASELNEGFSEDPATVPAAVAALRGAVVRFDIRPHQASPDLPATQGSGVVLAQDPKGVWVLTNAHVVEYKMTKGSPLRIDDRLKFRSSMVFFSNTDDEVETLHFRVSHVDRELDLAWVRVEMRGLPSLPIPRWSRNFTPLVTSKRIFALGFPSVSLRKEWLKQKPSDKNPRTLRISSGRVQDLPYTPPELLYHDADLLPGNSGGPILNEEGEIVGIVSKASFTNKSKYGYCSHIWIRENLMACPMIGVAISAAISRVPDGFGENPTDRTARF